MYCGVVEVPKSRLDDVLYAAKQLQIKGLVNQASLQQPKLSSTSSSSSLIRIENDATTNMDHLMANANDLNEPREGNMPSGIPHIDHKHIEVELAKRNTVIQKVKCIKNICDRTAVASNHIEVSYLSTVVDMGQSGF